MKSSADVFDAALALSEADRVRLIEQLVASLEGPDADAEQAWGAEIDRRVAQLQAGHIAAIPMDEAIARFRRAARSP